MNWQKSVLIMFIGSIILGFFITSSLLVNRASDIKSSITKGYVALWMALWMVILEMSMYGTEPPVMIYVITFIGILLVGYLARRQVLVNDREWLKTMIQHHSSAILTSDQILKKTTNDKVRRLAQWISKSQQEEIDYMNSLLNTSEPL